jgi:acetyl-CoA acetyltransferase
MKGVSVIGVGMIPFGKYPETNIADLGWPAVKAAIKDAGIDARRIRAVYSGTARGGAMVGQRIMGRLGLAALPIVNVENACSSSSSALAQGVIAVSSGAYDVVLVIGVEKLTKFGGGTLPLDEDDWEVRLGLTMPALYAMRAQRYMHDFGVSPKDVAAVSVKNRKNGALIPTRRCAKR